MAARKKIDWIQFIKEQEGSGKSIEVFARENGIHPNTFYKHRRKCKTTGLVEIKKIIFPVMDHNAITLNYRGLEINLKKTFCTESLRNIFQALGLAE